MAGQGKMGKDGVVLLVEGFKATSHQVRVLEGDMAAADVAPSAYQSKRIESSKVAT